MAEVAGVRAVGVRKCFDETLVLDGVDIEVDAGSTLTLLGPSGSGKTTLLRILAGLEQPDAGTVEVGGVILSAADVWVPPEERRIGMVFQDWALFPHLSVAGNVGFGLPRGQRRASQRIDEALELVGLAGYGSRLPATLSGGQQQRVAIARAVAPRPSVLLFDEPFSNLDASLRARVRTEIHRLLVELGITTVFVTHDQDEAFVLGDRVAVLADGHVVQHGAPVELYRSPATRWLADFVGEANFVAGAAEGDLAVTALGPIRLQHAATGAVDVLVRPEEISLAPDAADSADSAGASGEVELVEFLGHSTSYRVRVGQQVLSVRAPSTPIVRRGDRVCVGHLGGAAASYPA